MKRSEAFRRWQRQRVIDRKAHILLAYGDDYLSGWSRGQKGRFAKGKIHCSCWMCRVKSYDRPSHSDMKKNLFARQQMED